MDDFDFYGRRRRVTCAKETADWLAEKVQPNVAVTLTLVQRRSIQQGRHRHWVIGKPEDYAWTFNNLVYDLSKRYYGKAFERYGKQIAHFATLEGDGDAKRHHIHAGLRCPVHVNRDEFMRSISFYWGKSPWRMGDNKIEGITGPWTGYCLKEGSEALLCFGF